MDFAALRTADAGLVFDECSSWGGRSGRSGWSADGVSWLPPAWPLQADTMRELLKSTFPQMLPAGASGGPPPPVVWPTQTNRQGEGGPLGPHVVARGGIHFNGRGKTLRWNKTLV